MHPRGRRIGVIALLVTASLGTAARAGSSPLAFAWEMAKGGNWREAKYRWELQLARDPDDARILNNLAVAQEALGQPEAARGTYARALAAAGGDRSIEANRQRCEQFWTRPAGSGVVEVPSAPARPPRSKGKATRLTVELPVPPRIEVPAGTAVLVTNLITDPTPLLDAAGESVRLLRDELRQHAALRILPAAPAPAVPEQALDDLAANREFWKRLAREHGADLIVSGAARFERRDASGFREVDTVSAITGQKVRQTRFVEQERFALELELLFVDGATGELRLRDRLARSAVMAGAHNDPLTAFFELGEALAPDLLAIVRGRTQQETRWVFKR